MKRLVCDTGPLLHLEEAELLSLLPMAGEVVTVPAVSRELAATRREWRTPPWLQVVPLESAAAETARRWTLSEILDSGEAEALSLALDLGADWLLTDDATARWVAENLGQEVHGSLGVVLWAAATGHLPPAQAYEGLTRLADSSLWISARVLDEARSALEEIFSRR